MVDFSQIPWARGQNVDFATIGDLGKTYREGKMHRAREAELAKLDPNNPQGLQQLGLALLKAGDVQGATTLANLGNMQEELNLKRRQVSLSEKQAEEKPQYQVLEDQAGNKRLIRIEPYGRGTTDATPKEMGGGSSNPFFSGKVTESQSKDGLYTSRMLQAEKVLQSVEQAGTSVTERLRGGISNRIGINIRGDEYQKFDQAQRDFINAVLRRESGAVISPQEFDNATKQYFPAPGDTPQVIEQKRANRLEAIRGIGSGAGPSYKPPQGTEAIYNPQAAPTPATATAAAPQAPARAAPSSLVFNPNQIATTPQMGGPAQAAPQSGPAKPRTFSRQEVEAARANPQAALAEAKQAIAQNPAARGVVIRRLQQLGINPAGL